MSDLVRVTDHAVLRYLEHAHGLDVDAVRRHIACHCATGIELGAVSVTVERVKFVLVGGSVVTAIKARWPVLPRDRDA